MHDESSVHPAVHRLFVDGAFDAEAIDALRSGLAGADLTALLLDVMRHRAGERRPQDVARQYEHDRFVQPTPVNARRLLSLSALAADAIGDDVGFELIDISPVAPLGTSSAVSGISQNRVVSTTRSTEVASDPTTSLALEAACRRRELLRGDARSAEPIKLAAVHRVVRAQRFDGARSFQHFTLLGLVTAGRDIGGRGFETTTFVEHITALVAACRAGGYDEIAIRITDFDGTFGEAAGDIAGRLGDLGVDVGRWPDRPQGRGYYPSLCFKLAVHRDGEQVEVGDGGIVEWTQSLAGNRKERLMTSGLSLERLAML